MDNLKCFFFRTDGDGHEFFVPCDIIKEFDARLSLDPDSDEFYEHEGFDEYALG